MEMKAKRQQSAEELFGTVIDLPAEQRSEFLDQACQGQPELRLLVDDLMRDHQRLGSFLGGSVLGQDTYASIRILTPGSKLGRYTIVEPLGSGGMGIVYRALDGKLKRAVAIKLLAPGLLTGEEVQQRFRRESLVLARLSHSHIAAVYDVGQQDGIDYIVMECVPGESLAARLKSGALALRDATAITLQIAEALEEAHEQGVIHRDLKPANVMITPKGQVKVLDFGIAKLLNPLQADATVTFEETRGLVGTPIYMSPEQAHGKPVDTRTDLWSLGVVYYESLAGRPPFQGDGHLAVLRAITEDEPKPIGELRSDVPAAVELILARALHKTAEKRYQSATEMLRDVSRLLSSVSGPLPSVDDGSQRVSRKVLSMLLAVVILIAAVGLFFYHQQARRHWAREEAIPQITELFAANKPVTALLLLHQAQKYLLSDPQLKELLAENTIVTSITSSPGNATVEVQDYLAPYSAWHRLGMTPINKIRVPKGYMRWRVSKSGSVDLVTAPLTDTQMDFSLDSPKKAPGGMVFTPASAWTSYIGFIGWIGPYNMPAYYASRYEVTNSEFQKFVNAGGYQKQQYWTNAFTRDGHQISWAEAMAEFRDTTGRAGPSAWVGGHYPDGGGDYPVSGVSWFEASAYAAFAGNSLPVLAQWFQLAGPDAAGFTIQASNISGKELAPVGAFKGLGPYGTYDMAGNVREWVVNSVDRDLRFILGGSWRSPTYLYYCPEALSPFDRSDTNGFRMVRNLGPLPAKADEPIHRSEPDFTKMKPVSDEVFRAYKLLYEYPQSPLNAKSEGIVKETADWREEKITFDAAYNGERMSAYLYLPKNAKPPYQTVLFFPSARVLFLPSGVNKGELGDTRFFDYVIQSGRAVMYPIYQDTYDRLAKLYLPRGSQNIDLTTEWYKDAARSLDYLATRNDIDSNRLAYLGVSMGSAEGVFIDALAQARLKTAIFLDGGYFLETPEPGGNQAEFTPRIKNPVLMVNGRYDFTFSLEKSQNPMFEMLGTPAADKRHLVLNTPHDVTEQRPLLVKAVLDWLDHYLGRV